MKRELGTRARVVILFGVTRLASLAVEAASRLTATNAFLAEAALRNIETIPRESGFAGTVRRLLGMATIEVRLHSDAEVDRFRNLSRCPQRLIARVDPAVSASRQQALKKSTGVQAVITAEPKQEPKAGS